MSVNENWPQPAQWLLEQWKAAFISSIESMTGERPEVESDSGNASSGDTGTALCWQQSFNGFEPPAIWVVAPEQTWMEIGRRTLSAAGIADAGATDIRNTYLEVLNQSLGGVARAVAAQVGRQSACEKGVECAPAAGAFTAVASLKYRDGTRTVEFRVNPEFLAALESRGAEEAAPEELESVEGRVPALSETTGSRTMDVLLDLELPVSVSFGRTELPIKEVLKLTTGSIVELDRGLSEPVEVVVNNCVIARGEVVVVEGNYGVRIQHIVSRLDRLRSLK